MGKTTAADFTFKADWFPFLKIFSSGWKQLKVIMYHSVFIALWGGYTFWEGEGRGKNTNL